MEPLTVIYYFPIDAHGNEVGEPIPVDINPDGSANLSRLPKEVREHFEGFGITNTWGKRILPTQGTSFLHTLLYEADPYIRFRKEPNQIKA